jgi:transcriptional regulator with XRE-family HTH domain
VAEWITPSQLRRNTPNWTEMKESVGERIKALRTEQDMTLAELSEKAKISISYLSQIERNKTTPSLNTLTGIARAFNVGLRYFFETDAEEAHVVRAHQGQAGFDPDGSMRCVHLTSEAGEGKIEVCRVVLQPHTPSQHLALHSGEEFGFVLAGELMVTLADEQFELTAGDSIHYDALQPHTWSNPGGEPCVVIWARSPSGPERWS